jgi:hypothetical protein
MIINNENIGDTIKITAGKYTGRIGTLVNYEYISDLNTYHIIIDSDNEEIDIYNDNDFIFV